MPYGNPVDRRFFGHGKQPKEHGWSYPQTQADWVSEYNRRMDAYLSVPYTVGEIKRMHLFRALDPSGEIIDQTRRLLLDYAFVVDTDAAAIHGGGWTLASEDEGAAERGRQVWRRSRLPRHSKRWARNHAILGDSWLRALPGQVTTIAPQFVEPIYDSQNIGLERVIIRMQRFDGATLDERGESLDDVLNERVEELTADRVRIWENGRKVTDVPNPLGAIPLVHCQFTGAGEPEHGLGAAHGLDRAVSLVNSLMTQLAAIGNRYANPVWQAKGFDISAVGRLFGKTLNNVPVEGGLEAATVSLQGITGLLDAALRYHDRLRATLPEFQLQEASSTASGEALKTRASAFIGKMDPVRDAWFDGLEEVTAMAVAIQQGERWSDDMLDTYNVQGGPIVPMDASAELDRLLKVRDDMLYPDYIEALQRLGYVPERDDPEQYAEALAAQAATRDARAISAVQSMTGNGQALSEGEE